MVDYIYVIIKWYIQLYIYQNKVDEAKSYLEYGIKLAKKTQSLNSFYYRIALFYYDMKKYEQAIPFFIKTIENKKSVVDECTSTIRLFNCYVKTV